MLGLVPVKRVGRKALVGEGFRHVADGDMVCSQGEHVFPDFAPLCLSDTLPDVGARRNRAGPSLAVCRKRASDAPGFIGAGVESGKGSRTAPGRDASLSQRRKEVSRKRELIGAY
jgi:hypothetical protein